MLDILPNIFLYVNDGKTYKSLLYTSKIFHDMMIKTYPSKRYQVYNQMLSLIKLYHNKEWDWNQISCHPSMTMDIIKNNPSFPWKWEYISQNPNLTLDMIKNNKDKKWHVYWLLENNNLNLDLFENFEN